MNQLDLIVVGGGPAGLATAIEARMRGLSVAVIEPRTGVIDKACGEGLMPGALPMLTRLGVNPSGAPLEGVTYQSGTARVSHKFTTGPGRGVRRTELHSALRARALELGAIFIVSSLDSISQSGGVVTAIDSHQKVFQSRYLIGADGLHSMVAREVGLARPISPNRKRRFGLRQHFNVAPWSDFIEVYYTGRAEVYVTPISKTQIGVAVLGPKQTDYLATIAEVPELAIRLTGAQPASSLSGAGSFPQRTTARRVGNILLVGDASGYVDAITGEGLRLSFAQAQAAISCVVNSRPDAYERQWRRVSRNFRVLTQGLVFVANSALRPAIVPLAQRAPWLFGLVVDRLAR